MRSRLLRCNWLMFAAMLALVALGTLTIYSAGHARDAVVFHGLWKDNLVSAGIGLGLCVLLAAVDYAKVLKYLSAPAYAAALVFLVLVLVAGTDRFGGRRWLWFFQPSEISKLCILMLLAEIMPAVKGLRGFCLVAALFAVPCLLILLEPDLGTALTLVPAVTVMLLVAGLWRRGLVILLAAGVVATLTVLGAVGEAERPGTSPERREAILRWVPLRQHQIRRVKTYLYPEADERASGYNLKQSKIAIGSGGFAGKGFGNGEANRLKYLPPSISMNDFIFCVYAEERGFIGTLTLLVLFGALLVPAAWTAFRTTDERGRLLALGISTLVFAHVFINIAMSVGMVPITGLPLPFVSAGRTFLITVMCGFGLIQSVAIHGSKGKEG